MAGLNLAFVTFSLLLQQWPSVMGFLCFFTRSVFFFGFCELSFSSSANKRLTYKIIYYVLSRTLNIKHCALTVLIHLATTKDHPQNKMPWRITQTDWLIMSNCETISKIHSFINYSTWYSITRSSNWIIHRCANSWTTRTHGIVSLWTSQTVD